MDEVQGLSKEALVEKYTPLIRSIASQIRNRLNITIEFDDLVSYGRLGLLEASQRFDYKLGVSFKTFAYYRIKGAIYDGLRTMEVITRRKDPRIKFEEAANQVLSTEALRQSAEPRRPSLRDDIEELQGLIGSLVPIYFLANDAMDQLSAQQKDSSAEDQAALNQEKSLLRGALNHLSEKERSLIQYYYYQDFTLEQAATKLGLSKSWASRLHSRALSKLKDAFQPSKKKVRERRA
jgi:RNA polymerase sigma factor FliA